MASGHAKHAALNVHKQYFESVWRAQKPHLSGDSFIFRVIQNMHEVVCIHFQAVKHSG